MASENPYADILNLERPASPGHPPLSPLQRAAQFSPFASLTGYDGIIRETARLTDAAMEEDEDRTAALNETLCRLKRRLREEKPLIRLVCFEKDAKKAGGAYIARTGRLKKLDEAAGLLYIEGQEPVAFSDLLELEEAET